MPRAEGSMFCFCLQSSLLKLQALEGDSCSSLGPSPDNSPPALTPSQTQTHTLSPALDGKQDSQALCHSYPGRENGPPGKKQSSCLPPTTFFISASRFNYQPRLLFIILTLHRCLPTGFFLFLFSFSSLFHLFFISFSSLFSLFLFLFLSLSVSLFLCLSPFCLFPRQLMSMSRFMFS